MPEKTANIPADAFRVSLDGSVEGPRLSIADAPTELVARFREDGVATYDSSSHVEALVPASRRTYALLGVAIIAAGILAPSDIVFANIVSVELMGLTAVAAGAFEIIHALWAKGWGGFVWQIQLGGDGCGWPAMQSSAVKFADARLKLWSIRCATKISGS
jgi:hypothetical protein